MYADFKKRMFFDFLVDLAVGGIGTGKGRKRDEIRRTWRQVGCMLLVEAL